MTLTVETILKGTGLGPTQSVGQSAFGGQVVMTGNSVAYASLVAA